ncbi:hypothetical protein [Cytobacillus dafuensis]|uniref:Endonuclease n=1 Tax=Cytobacillus dafuensis TaxID=1742359 RepID=A0A5B8Z751_CYTDA|nr:hypothetical protein [Cytobacillus dafuensis]QED48767.1 endonuclease [Cytobacillus dafuensis]
MKKLFVFLTILSLLLAVAGCSSSKDQETKTDTEQKETKELTDTDKSKMYNSVRVAELKVNEIFHKETAADGTTPIINSSFSDENKAVEFLSKYYSEDVAKSIYTHYATDKKTPEGQLIVNSEPYFTPSFLDTNQDDVTIEGDKNKATIKIADNKIYSIELVDNQYIVTSVE